MTALGKSVPGVGRDGPLPIAGPLQSDRPFPPLEPEKLASVIQEIPIGVAITAPDGRIQYANPYLSAVLGVACREVVGLDLCAFRSREGVRTLRRIKPQLLLGKSWRGEIEIRKHAGEIFHALESIYALREKDGSITHFVHFFQDTSPQKLARTIYNLAFHDKLTGLPNRNLLHDRLHQAIAAAQRNQTEFAVMYIDIDGFKRINDTWGHDAGDKVLRAVALRLRSALRRSDTLARVGGDEFVAILENAGELDSVSQIAEKLLAACMLPYHLGDRTHHPTISIGIGLYPRHAQTAEALLKSADHAMYEAKAAGRNVYRMSKIEPMPHR